MALKMKPKWLPPGLSMRTADGLTGPHLYYTKGETTNLSISNLVAGAIAVPTSPSSSNFQPALSGPAPRQSPLRKQV